MSPASLLQLCKLTLRRHAGARDRVGPGSRGAQSAEASGSEAEGDEEVRLLGGSGAAAPERDDEFEAELAALVLKHQGRAPPASAPVQVVQQYQVQEMSCWGLCSLEECGGLLGYKLLELVLDLMRSMPLTAQGMWPCYQGIDSRVLCRCWLCAIPVCLRAKDAISAQMLRGVVRVCSPAAAWWYAAAFFTWSPRLMGVALRSVADERSARRTCQCRRYRRQRCWWRDSSARGDAPWQQGRPLPRAACAPQAPR